MPLRPPQMLPTTTTAGRLAPGVGEAARSSAEVLCCFVVALDRNVGIGIGKACVPPRDSERQATTSNSCHAGPIGRDASRFFSIYILWCVMTVRFLYELHGANDDLLTPTHGHARIHEGSRTLFKFMTPASSYGSTAGDGRPVRPARVVRGGPAPDRGQDGRAPRRGAPGGGRRAGPAWRVRVTSGEPNVGGR